MLGVALLSAACASSGTVPVPKPFPDPGPNTRGGNAPVPPPEVAKPPTTTATATAPPPKQSGPLDFYALVGTALQLRGTPYRDGGADPHGFDCSGFTKYVFAQYGVSLPRAVRDQFKMGTGVRSESVGPGDLLFFTTTEPGASHVAIAVGGDEFVHAPSSAGVVRVERLSSSYWAQRYIGARRLN
jgi:cell wall-associated NlpC family hydrolase